MTARPSAAALARIIDHTLLKPESTADDVAALARHAAQLGTWSICVSPAMLPIEDVSMGPVKVCTVVGFPSGKHSADIKAAEAAEAVRNGADEVDMVINLGLLIAGDADAVQAEIAAVRRAAPSPTVLKVIIESAALSDDAIVLACKAAAAAQADFVKTSTGDRKSVV